MKKILVIGAGLSSSYLIKYLITEAETNNWHVTVADSSLLAASAKTNGHKHATAIELNAGDSGAVEAAVKNHDLVISLLPPTMHVGVARICVANQKHLVTASYVSEDMQQLNQAAKDAGVLLLNECGLDPGIDHLSAMKLIDEVKARGGNITVFKSFCGGLVAPEFDNNPWHYKFTWNPRNVVLAGQATAKYLEHHELKFIPPSRIFTQTEDLHIIGYGDFESYANRDSLGYIEPYGIESAHTVLRGTLRRKGYSASWNALVKLGLTDDTFTIKNSANLTYREWVSAFTPGNNIQELEQRVATFLGISIQDELFVRLQWLGLFETTPVNLTNATPAQILQQLLQQKWKLENGELDMIVMHHEIEAMVGSTKEKISSSLVVKGETEVLTAMAKTVGLPMAIAAKLILQNKVSLTGVHIPITPALYHPILSELEQYGVVFTERHE